MNQSRLWQVEVVVMPKPGVNDPEGEAILGGLSMLGYRGVRQVRAGRMINLRIEADSAEEARAEAESMAAKLLANPVIEVFEVFDRRVWRRDMTARAGVISFPGSNGDHDALFALKDNLHLDARMIDYRENDLVGFDLVVVPGGFAYGDHLRCGAIARFAPIVEPLRAFAERGGPVIGICNGFQVLTEAHLLPGALLRNHSLQFICEWVTIRAEDARCVWTHGVSEGSVLRLPVAHGEGAYSADDETLDRLEENGQVAFRYCDPTGEVTAAANINGSARSIAGIANERGNVLGLMPHPERACDPLLGRADGLVIMTAALHALNVAV